MTPQDIDNLTPQQLVPLFLDLYRHTSLKSLPDWQNADQATHESLVKNALKQLKDQYIHCLSLLFNWVPPFGNFPTQKEVAEKLGVLRGRVSHIKMFSLKKINKYIQEELERRQGVSAAA